MNKIERIVDQVIIRDLVSDTKDAVLAEMCSLLSDNEHVTDAKALLYAIRTREAIMSTGIGMGIAIPHAKIASVTDIVIAVGSISAGIDYQSLDDSPVYKIILIAASNTQGDEFLKVLGKIGAFLNDEETRAKFLHEHDPEAIRKLLKSIDAQ